MRFDSVGMFWEDGCSRGKKGERARILAAIPETGWTPPRDFPNLAAAKVIAIDTETYDPELLDYGPGWARGRGHIVGISVAVDDGASWYFPMRHEVQSELNLDPDHVLAWARGTLAAKHQPKVGANLMYDVGWLRHEGVRVEGPLIDVQYAEALLRERGDVDLDTLGYRYLKEGKVTNDLYEWCAKSYGGKVNGAQRANLYRAPPCLVGPYAEGDAAIPLRVIREQYVQLHREGLLELFDIECRLIPLLIEMREAGVSVDLNKAEQLRHVLGKRSAEELDKLKAMAGFAVDVNSSTSLGRAFDTLGIPYKRTAKGKPSFTKDFLEALEHPVGDVIRDIRKFDKLRSTFVESYILDSHVNGKVYGQFHPLRGDEGGTRSGRFSSSTPNLQNIPSRDKELAPLVRGLFIPDHGHRCWRKYDYSQIEYRFLIHFAVGPLADEMRAYFNAHPDTDYHEMALDMVAPYAGWDLSVKGARSAYRKPIKNINFGLIYGMGIPKLTRSLGLTKKEGADLFAAYHKAVPFAKATMDACSEEAQNTGKIRTILGRISRFDLFEPMNWDDDRPALPYHEAILHYGEVRRAYTHKGLNRRLQGSAADLMKVAMLRCYEEGVFTETGVPRLTVHDELDFSDHGGSDPAFREMRRIMETALDLRIPVKADGEWGPDWGHVEALPLALA
ncbi:DNA polymerase A [Microcystis phage Me-ZS1]|nr:DNA polymerase A [Microcystis phage Me-ZS1]